MLFTVILCWLWGILILTSFIGWGWLIGQIVFRRQLIDAGLKACWGLSIYILAGGLLNLFGLIYKPILFSLIGIGVLFFLIDLFSEKKQTIDQVRSLRSKENRRLLIAVIFVLFIVACGYTSSIYTIRFNTHDDFHAYLVHPMKMLQMHTLGADPFNDRQMLSSLGAMSFLQTLILSVFPLDCINSMDRGIGILIVVLLLTSYKEKTSRLSSRLFLIAVFLVMLLSAYIANSASVILPIALFLALFRLIEGPLLGSKDHLKNAVIVALMASAICALKSDTIPFVAPFVCTAYLFRTVRSGKFQRGIFIELCLVGFFVMVMLSPWMISMYKSCGTALYPIFGKGYHASAYGNFSFHSDPWTIRKMFWFTLKQLFSKTSVFTFLILAGFYLYRSRKKIFDKPLLLSVIISAISGIILLTYASGAHTARHAFPFLSMAIIVLMAELARSAFSQEKSLCDKNCIVLFIVTGIILGAASAKSYSIIGHASNRVKSLLDGPRFIGTDDESRYRQAQNAVPESEAILARLQKPFLLDFQRNTVYVADWPGDISPPPGLPAERDPEAVADYFALQSIRYIAYSYATEAGYSKEHFGYRLKPSTHSWVYALTKRIFDFQDDLTQLMKTRKIIYDDGDICIIDLQQKANGL